jgi:hypothetical protein
VKHWDWVRVISGPLKDKVGHVLGELNPSGKRDVSIREMSCDSEGEYNLVDDFDESELELLEQ